ncbi:hypothetical protein R9C00_05705 [Flammeovirgaceae bacterium SG7u.111]|nr:hypothetical protein [Flammeovirgaceae bacterium SG7u.132]WPO36936.1 hypothetical protein R9C00_05705 [Flammeovirgaceae bacterium SG7u.111]
MKLYLLLPALLVAYGLCASSPKNSARITYGEAVIKASQIRNFGKFLDHEQEEIIQEILFWENESEEFREVTEDQRLPYSMLNLTQNKNEYHLIEHSPFKGAYKRLNWIPSLSLFYESMLVHHKMNELYGKEQCPPQFLILALLSHETYMRDILGDGGQSTGMCQLYRPSAKYITTLSRNKDIFKQLIYFDKKGEQHFYNQRKMLEFIYHFLVKEKGYNNLGKKKKGVSAYNGGGERARHYGKLVLLKAYYYEGLAKALKAETDVIAVRDLYEWSRSILPHTFIGFDGFDSTGEENEDFEKHLTEKERSELEIFRYEISQYVLELRKPNFVPRLISQHEQLVIESPLLEKSFVTYEDNRDKMYDALISKGCFLIIPSNRTIFSFLRENTYQIMSEDNKFMFYTLADGEEEFIPSESAMKEKLKKGQVVLTTALAGDTVYIKPGYPIYKVKRTELKH